MKSKIPNQNCSHNEWCEEDLIKALKDAAEYDRYMFGDYDCDDWLLNVKSVES